MKPTLRKVGSSRLLRAPGYSASREFPPTLTRAPRGGVWGH